MEIATPLPSTKRSSLLGFLFFIRMGAVASYSVMFSTLSLYLVNYFGFPKALASNIVGIFVAFVYILPLLGSVMGQKLLPFRTLFVYGVIIQIVGALCLAKETVDLMYWGLALFLMGSMVSSLSVNMLITQAYRPEEKTERKAAFLWNYSGMNAGFLIGYLFSGMFQLQQNYTALFLWVAVFSSSAVVLMLIASKVLLAEIEKRKTTLLNSALTFGIMSILVYGIHLLLKHAYVSKNLLLSCSVLIFLGCFSYLYKQNKASRQAIRIFFCFAMLSISFWSIYMLTPTSLMLFIQDYVKTDYGTIHIPPQWLDIVDATVLVIFTPALAWGLKYLTTNYNYKLTTERSFQLGFLVYIIGIALVLMAIYFFSTPIGIFWIVIYMALQAMAEAFIGPSGYALVGDILPEKIRSTATGLWMMTLGIAGLFASGISNIAFSHIATQQYTGIVSYQHTFAFILFLAGFAFLFLIKIQKSLQHTEEP